MRSPWIICTQNARTVQAGEPGRTLANGDLLRIDATTPDGPIVRRALVRSLDEMMRVLEALPDRFEVCYEASCGYGHYHDLLSPIAARVTVAHPGRLRLIFRSKDKNDRKDAERLAKLLYLGEAPAVHVPEADVRTWRELITCRGRVIAKRTRAKNSLRTLLRCAGVVPPGRPALWTKEGLEWLRRLELPTESQRLRRFGALAMQDAAQRAAFWRGSTQAFPGLSLPPTS